VHDALLSGRRAASEAVDGDAPGSSVIVVGAGVAGLACAVHLVAAGFEVVAVEARDRAGGRVSTSDELGMPLDLGASWIHGVDGNPLTEHSPGSSLQGTGTARRRSAAATWCSPMATAP